VQSPQILQLSGPAELLRKQGIDVVHDASEVGENLQDHLQLRTIVTLADKKDALNSQVRSPIGLARMGLDWLLAQRGPLTVGAGQVGGAMCTRYATNDRPDLQLFVMPLSVDKPGAPCIKIRALRLPSGNAIPKVADQCASQGPNHWPIHKSN
jgi:choline dehydrogenase